MSQRTVDVAPFDLGAPDARSAVLCIHGLTGTPYEIRPVGEALAAQGMRAVGLALPGHNATPEALASCRHEAWLEAVDAAFRDLSDRHERVFLAGISLGGLLSLWLAAERDVAGIAVIGTPLRLRGGAPWLVPLAKYVAPYLKKRNGSDIRNEAARRVHPSYPVMPLASVHQLMQLQRRVRRALHRVTDPVLVAHGQLDGTAHPADADVIHRSVASASRELLWLPKSGHVVPVDHDGPRLSEAIARFFAGLV